MLKVFCFIIARKDFFIFILSIYSNKESNASFCQDNWKYKNQLKQEINKIIVTCEKYSQNSQMIQKSPPLSLKFNFIFWHLFSTSFLRNTDWRNGKMIFLEIILDKIQNWSKYCWLALRLREKKMNQFKEFANLVNLFSQPIY